MRWLPDGWRRPPGRHVRPRGPRRWPGDLVRSGLVALVGAGLAVGFALLYASVGVPLPQPDVPPSPPSTIWQPSSPPGREPATGPQPPEPPAAGPAGPGPAAGPATPPAAGVLVGWSTGKASRTPQSRLLASLPPPPAAPPAPSPTAPPPDPPPPVPSPAPSDSPPAVAAPSPTPPTTAPPSPLPWGKPVAGPTCPHRDRDHGRPGRVRDRGQRPCRRCHPDVGNPEHRRPGRPQVHRRHESEPDPGTSPGTKLSVPPAAADQTGGGPPTPTPETDREETSDG
jgi:hypothetical protein